MFGDRSVARLPFVLARLVILARAGISQPVFRTASFDTRLAYGDGVRVVWVQRSSMLIVASRPRLVGEYAGLPLRAHHLSFLWPLSVRIKSSGACSSVGPAQAPLARILCR